MLACATLSVAAAQPIGAFERADACAVLAVANRTMLSDNLPRGHSDDVRTAYNFDDATYDCGENQYATDKNDFRPAYFGIGFSSDTAQALVGVETTARGADDARGYRCIFARNDEGGWEAIGCRAVSIATYSPPPDPLPVP